MKQDTNDTKSKIGNFFRPYGEWGEELGRKMRRENVEYSAEFTSHAQEIFRKLIRGMKFGAVLGIALSLLNAFSLLEKTAIIQTIMSSISRIEGYCDLRQPKATHTLWILIMHSYTAYIFMHAVRFIPRRDLRTGAESIPKFHHFILGVLCSCLVSFVYFHLSMKLLVGCAQEGRIFGHGDLVFRAFTNSDFGLITIGPLMWIAGPIAWGMTLWGWMLLTYRIFVLRKFNLDY